MYYVYIYIIYIASSIVAEYITLHVNYFSESSVLKKKRVCVWEDDWDDPDLEDDFSVQLR